MKTFLCRYRVGTEWWSFELKAESFADAEMHLRAIQQNGGGGVMPLITDAYRDLRPIETSSPAVWWRNRWAAP